MRVVFLGNFQVDYSSESHHAASLEALGHEVIRLQEGKADGAQVLEEALMSDMLVFVHTHGWRTPGLAVERVLERLNRVGIPTVTYHLDLWFGLQRQKDLERDPFYRSIGWFFTVDKLMADWFTQNTNVKGRFLPAAVFGPECYKADQTSKYSNDVIFVGSKRYHPEWPWRPQLIDWLRDTYGPRFTHVGGDGDTGTIRGDELNRVYAGSKVAVGDTLCLGYNYPHYASDRLFECPGRGGFNLFPRITGVGDWFKEGEEIAFYDYGDLDGLKAKIDHYLANEDEREAIRSAGHERVKAEHTYSHRWQAILETVL